MLPESVCTEATSILNFAATEHVDAPTSHIIIASISGFLVLLQLISMRKRATYFRRAREADALVKEDAPLLMGTRFIRGTVEYAEGSDRAVSVHVEQAGKETKNKNNWSHSWTEIRRQTFVEPFYVRCANGERVRVEPGSDVLLVDDPDRAIWTEKWTRTRIAELTANETVIVEGVLTRGPDPEGRGGNSYRNNTTGWIMRPAPGEKMHLSAENLGVRHEVRAKDYDSTAAILRFIVIFIQLFFLTYHVRLFLGTDTCAQVVSKDTYITTNKGKSTTHYRLWLDVAGTEWEKLDRDVAQRDYRKVEQGTVIAFRKVGISEWASMPGHSSSFHGVAIVFALLSSLVGIGVFASSVWHRRWYEGRLDDTGSGKLPEPPGKQPKT